ncbi:leucine-rich repeat protein [Breznakiellaceae bacterium SP9]
MGDGAFASNQLRIVTIPTSVRSIGRGAFTDNPLERIDLPDSVTTIGNYAFNINALTSITLAANMVETLSANNSYSSGSYTETYNVFEISCINYYNKPKSKGRNVYKDWKNMES